MTIIEEDLKTMESINRTAYYQLMNHKVFECETKKNHKIEKLLVMGTQLNGSKLITNEETSEALNFIVSDFEKKFNNINDKVAVTYSNYYPNPEDKPLELI
ncbi:hypothetical protein [Spiroplasma endosymbiont of 'Nebria riversi']|uniref:hypothetical protein n=1 Tax=Spiroplasma endosymbiont of 'Nebria riversi' TaxID=2792084 RepID=UPI001C04CDBC|nr:hypothetical protein [Spiroplasma endosymbiont of 'Nebria riversi']